MKAHLAYRLCSVIAMIGACGGAAVAADGIATVTEVINEGFRTPPGSVEQRAQRSDPLIQNEALRTSEESSIQVKFVDGSELGVEAASEVVLSDYVFDGSASTGLINLNDGLFHFTSNGKDDQGVRLRTPVATIGVRGTEFLVHVDRDNATIIDILSGAVEATPHGGGKPATCVEGQSILVAGPDEDARCGDLGSFSTAASAGSKEGEDLPEPGHGGQNKDRVDRSSPSDRDPPDPDNGGDGGGGEGGSGEGGETGQID